jgi:hypothetical protein
MGLKRLRAKTNKTLTLLNDVLNLVVLNDMQNVQILYSISFSALSKCLYFTQFYIGA